MTDTEGRAAMRSESEMRARFEAWAVAQSFRASNIDTTRDTVVPEWYVSDTAALTWRAWQAALASQGEQQGVRLALADELLEHAGSLERMAADDRETGESIEQAIENGEGYTADEPQDVAAGLQHDADRAEKTAALLRKAAAALAAAPAPGVR